MSINFVLPDTPEETRIVVRFELEKDDYATYVNIYYDDICVAYLNSTDGGLIAIPIEAGSWYASGGQTEDRDQLLSKGVRLVNKGTEERQEWYIPLNNG